ncbi:MAG: hypothetical protein ACLP50_25800, partial [Solirubrobacteraceae bacterium]
MRHSITSICVLACAAVVLVVAPAQRAQAVPAPVSGKIIEIGYSTLTIQTGGRLVGVINALTATANALSARDYPYVWGGGHAEAGVASVGIQGGPGYNGRRIGYDCSGSVAAVLAGAGLWPAGGAVPNDAGVIAQLLAAGVIARGPGEGAAEVMLYDEPGVHIFMNIDGRFFGTSDGGGGDPKGVPTWLDDGASDAWNRAFKRYHIVPSVLADKTSYGHDFTFQTSADPSIAIGAELGDKVTISYAQTRSGSIRATAIRYAGSVTTSGTVVSIAPDDSSLTIQTAGGQSLTFSTSTVANLLYGLEDGDVVQVTSSPDPSGLLIPHDLQILSTPSPATPTTPTTPSTPTTPTTPTTPSTPTTPTTPTTPSTP